jgi:hypothetical protein
MKTVRVHGCLPTLAVLASLLVLGLLAAAFGTVALAIGAGLALLVAAQRLIRRLLRGSAGRRPGTGAGPGASPRERPTVEVLPPGWIEREETGPVVDAEVVPLDRGADTAAPDGSRERERTPRG